MKPRIVRVASLWARGLAHRLRHGAPKRGLSIGDAYYLRCRCGATAFVVPGSLLASWTGCPTFRLIDRLTHILATPPSATVIRG